MKKKLIEVALPLEAINKASAREKSIRHGHPSTLHLWWARRPLAAARAVIFAQMVDDPSAHPDLFPTEKAQEKERQRLFRIIEDLVQWENTTNEAVLERARAEIWQSWRAACAENVDHPRAKELFNRHKLPAFHDPFAGGGALPLEAQRLGLEAYASDLNPVAVLINKAMIEIPPKFAGKPPVNPESRKDKELFKKAWHGAQGLAEDVRYYGQWMRDEAEKRIGHLYPTIEITADMAKDRKDLKVVVGQKLPVIAWLWARTVRSPNPAARGAHVPLVRSFWLSTKVGKMAWVEPVVDQTLNVYRFAVLTGKGKPRAGTVSRNGGVCLLTDSPMPFDHIRAEAKAGRMGVRLLAIVADGPDGRVYLSETEEQTRIATGAEASDKPDTDLPDGTLGFRVQAYGMDKHYKLFTRRQLALLTTVAELVGTARARVLSDLPASAMDDKRSEASREGYSDAVATYLGEASSKLATFHNTLAYWRSKEGKSATGFGRQALAMTWDFVEVNPFVGAGGDMQEIFTVAAPMVISNLPARPQGFAEQQDATRLDDDSRRFVFSTDPPYYDNVPYADLSDFFYVWLRRSLSAIHSSLFSTLLVPKAAELVADPFRHGGRERARAFFETGLGQAFGQMASRQHPNFPLTVYYAFKQAEIDQDDDDGMEMAEIASTGWETMLVGLLQAGFTILGTWPLRTENRTRMRATGGGGSNALASSIVLVCRPRASDAPIATRREFISALKAELPVALDHLQRGNIAPVDLAQAAIGPGMAVYTRYARVLDAEGKPLSVREALALINQTLDEALAEQEGDFDADSRWALAWFEQSGFDAGEYGVAETLSKAKNTSVGGMVDAGILNSKGGKVRLLKPSELPKHWNPDIDPRLTAWEMVHHMIRTLEADGESAAAELVAKLGSKAEIARELAYRLYTMCERKKRTQEALSYNGLVQSWPEIVRLSRDRATPQTEQVQMFSQE
jgi:putative DNA methylase